MRRCGRNGKIYMATRKNWIEQEIARSREKAAAARENGKLGGRPRLRDAESVLA